MNGTDALPDSKELATLAGGCFWCLEAVFREMVGVESVICGYTGGETAHPRYAEVCSGATGHAEAVRIVFDPAVVSYRELLEVFFAIHDPTTLNRQGADIGTQYRSAIFYHSERQRAAAEEMMARLEKEGRFGAPLVTQLVPATAFYRAEDEHQQYFARNPGQPYCMWVVAPKVEQFRRRFAAKRKTG